MLRECSPGFTSPLVDDSFLESVDEEWSATDSPSRWCASVVDVNNVDRSYDDDDVASVSSRPHVE
jgi:hypothetical protein